MKNLSKSLNKNVDYVKQSNGENKDLVVREVFCAKKKLAIVFLNEEANSTKIEKYIVEPIITQKSSFKNIQYLQKKLYQ